MLFQSHVSILANKTQSIVRSYFYNKKNYKYNNLFLRERKFWIIYLKLKQFICTEKTN